MKIPPLLKKLPGMQRLLPASFPDALGRFQPHVRGGGRRLLVFETDGFVLRGVVVELRQEQAQILAWAESHAIEYKEGVSEITGQLKNIAGNPPRRAILLTPSMVTAMLDLPLKENKPRPEREMQELIHWEMEPLFAQQVARWNIGAILVGRGHLNQDQREKIMTQSRSTGAHQNARFGELAIELGLVTRVQVEEALDLQQHLQVMDDKLLCSWVPPSDAGEHAGWLVSAIGQEMRQRWVEAFSQNEIRLDWLYPQIGPSIGALPDAGNGVQAVLEIHQGMTACLRSESGNITGMQFTQSSGDRLSVGDCLEACHALFRTSMQTLWLAGCYNDHPGIVTQLAERLDRGVNPIPVKFHQVDSPRWSTAGLMGAAAHALALPPEARLVRVMGEPPAPPFYRRPLVWAAFALFAGSFLLGGLEYSFYRQRQALSLERGDYQNKLAVIEGAHQHASDEAMKAKAAETRLQSLRKNLEAADFRYGLLHEIVPSRVAFVRAFMGLLGTTITPELILNRVTELPSLTIEVEGWALSEQAAQEFAQDLGDEMQRFLFRVENLMVRSESGPLGLPGYVVTMRLVPVKKSS